MPCQRRVICDGCDGKGGANVKEMIAFFALIAIIIGLAQATS